MPHCERHSLLMPGTKQDSRNGTLLECPLGAQSASMLAARIRDTPGSAAALAARWRNDLRGSFIAVTRLGSHTSCILCAVTGAAGDDPQPCDFGRSARIRLLDSLDDVIDCSAGYCRP